MVAMLGAAGRYRIQIICANRTTRFIPGTSALVHNGRALRRCQKQCLELSSPRLAGSHLPCMLLPPLLAEQEWQQHWGLNEVGKEKGVQWCDNIFDVTALQEFFVKEGLCAAVTCPCWMLTRDVEIPMGLPWEAIKSMHSRLFLL